MSSELWFRTGTAKQRTYVAVHSINIDQALSKALPAFHALTECDTVSQLCGIGKQRPGRYSNNTTNCWMTLDMRLSDETLANAEEFICRLYSGYKTDTKIKSVWFKLFNKGSNNLEKLPPTQSSLQQNIKRAHHQCDKHYYI